MALADLADASEDIRAESFASVHVHDFEPSVESFAEACSRYLVRVQAIKTRYRGHQYAIKYLRTAEEALLKMIGFCNEELTSYSSTQGNAAAFKDIRALFAIRVHIMHRRTASQLDQLVICSDPWRTIPEMLEILEKDDKTRMKPELLKKPTEQQDQQHGDVERSVPAANSGMDTVTEAEL